MNLKDFLDDCQKENIIDQQTVDRMYQHFQLKKQRQVSSSISSNTASSNNGLIITVGIIGVLLIGFGIIYLFAHNWDKLSRGTKTTMSFIPLILSIAANIYTLTKRKESIVWQESTAISSFLAVGSMLALILQIYQLPGIENYFFTYWCALCLPIVYLLRSHYAVFIAMLLMLLNLFSNPLDQSSLIEVPWFGSLLLFSALIPYFKRLYTLREPNGLYVAHQITLPILLSISVIASVSSSHASIWLILYLILANFLLFGTSIFLRRSNRSPNVMSILSYLGLSLLMSFLIFNKDWNFDTLLQADNSDFRLFFIPVLLLFALIQLSRFYLKESISSQNSYRLMLLIPLVFIGFNFAGYDVQTVYQFVAIVGAFTLIHFSQEHKDQWQLFPALGMISIVLFNLMFNSNAQYALFFFSIIPSLYILMPRYTDTEQSKDIVSADKVAILCVQLLVLIVASFRGFWEITRFGSHSMSDAQVGLVVFICVGTIVIAIKSQHQFVLNKSNYTIVLSTAIPFLIFIGCVSPIGIQLLYTLLLLFIGIVVLVMAAKQSNLTIANLAIGLIALVVFCRFVDSQGMSLTVKGILFILIGCCFFFANYLIIKNKKNETK